MTAFQIVMKAASLRTTWLGVASVLAGTAAAAAHGNAEPLPAMICLLFVFFAQCTSNIIHRYYNELRGEGENRADSTLRCDDVNRPITFILSEGIKIFGVLTAMTSLVILSMAGWWVLGAAALIGLVIWGDNAGKKPFSRSPFYPISTFIIFGPIGVTGTALVQSQRTSEHLFCYWDIGPAIVFSIITGLMAMNSHIMFGLCNRRNNIRNSSTTFYGRYGTAASICVTTTATLIYTAVGLWAPFAMDIIEWEFYLPVPIVCMCLGITSIILSRNKLKGKTAWRLTLANIMLFATASLAIMLLTGYPYRTHDVMPIF